MKKSHLKIIGRLEKVHLPDWGFYDLDAKIDTGAYTSSLHGHNIQAFEKAGEKWVKFHLLDPAHEAYSNKRIEIPVHDERDVKSSNGTISRRYFIKTNIHFFGERFQIECSLTDRSAMKYPVLIGRKFLRKGAFLVDVSNKYLSKLNTRNNE